MTLQRRILSGFGLILGLVGVVLIWAIVNIVNLGDASEAILRENFQSILAAENMIDAIERQDSASLLILLGFKQLGLAQLRENESHFLQWLGRAKDNITIAGEADILNNINEGYNTYLLRLSALRDIASSSPDDAAAAYHDDVNPQFTRVRDACISLRQINEKTMFEASNRASRTASIAVWSTVVVGLSALVLGLIFSLLLSQRLVYPLKQVVDASEQMAEGNYDSRVNAEGSDELAQLADSFNSMSERLAQYHRMNVERIHAEQKRSDAVLRSIDDGVVVVDVEMKIVNLNRTATDVLQLEPDKALGHHFLECVRHDRLFGLLKQTVEGDTDSEESAEDHILSLGKGGQARDFLYSVTPVYSDTGCRSGAVLILRDVTRLKQLDRMKSEFVMTASHELRTPLQSIGMSIELLREQTNEKLTDSEKKLLGTASEEVQRLKSLVNDLLDLSKIEAGKVVMQFADVDLVALISKAVNVLRAQADESEITLESDIADDLPSVYADAGKIMWVLTNLIGNALRFVDRGGQIRVHAKPFRNWVHVMVTDDGKGIALEDQSRIFDKFVQINDEGTVGGTGLGLSICREIVRAHNGTIWVDSIPGEGSVFTFTLPVVNHQAQESN